MLELLLNEGKRINLKLNVVSDIINTADFCYFANLMQEWYRFACIFLKYLQATAVMDVDSIIEASERGELELSVVGDAPKAQ